jgi:hypothetical protein
MYLEDFYQMKSLAMDTELWCYFMAYLFDEEIIKRLD